jgi:hypothetical protein
MKAMTPTTLKNWVRKDIEALAFIAALNMRRVIP